MTCKTLGILYLGGHHTACWQQ